MNTDDEIILRFQNCHAREGGHPGFSIVVDSRQKIAGMTT